MAPERQLNEVQFSDLTDDLALKTFKCKNEQVTIRLDETKIPRIDEKKKYLEYFGEFFQNIRIISTNKNFRTLPFFLNVNISDWRTSESNNENCDDHWYHRNTKVCADWRKLELNISDDPLNKGFFLIGENLLRYCEKLEHLKIVSHYFDIYWMERQYPTLTSLSLELGAKDKIERDQIERWCSSAKIFFTKNPQISNFECSEIEILQQVLLNVTTIERLVLRINIGLRLVSVTNHFTKYSRQDRINYLEVVIEEYNMTDEDCTALLELNLIRPITSLVYTYSGLDNELESITKLKSLVHLKIGTRFEYPMRLMDALSKQLPNLKDLQFGLAGTNISFKNVAMQFIRHSLKMRKLTFINLRRDSLKFSVDDLVKLNECRSSMHDAAPIAIGIVYNTCHDNFPEFISPDNPVLHFNLTYSGDHDNL